MTRRSVFRDASENAVMSCVARIAPSTRTLPVTCKAAMGAVLLIPTLAVAVDVPSRDTVRPSRNAVSPSMYPRPTREAALAVPAYTRVLPPRTPRPHRSATASRFSTNGPSYADARNCTPELPAVDADVTNARSAIHTLPVVVSVAALTLADAVTAVAVTVVAVTAVAVTAVSVMVVLPMVSGPMSVISMTLLVGADVWLDTPRMIVHACSPRRLFCSRMFTAGRTGCPRPWRTRTDW